LRRAPLVGALGLALAGGLSAGLAGADSFTPVRLTITVAPTARLDASLPITVAVSADAGALDDRTGPLRIRVKLAGECGGTYDYTQGAVLLDQQLNPQPATGHTYSAVAQGSGRPAAYGVQTVCVWLNDSEDRTWANDQSLQVDVSQACTTAAARYDAARRQRRARRLAGERRRQRALASDRGAAARACGPGVAL
jgi:hypothetical protein